MIMDPYVYPGTNILKNKFDIQDKKELENLERRISNKNAVHILKTDNSFKCSLSYLQQIHKKLFQEIYPFIDLIVNAKYFLSGMKTYLDYSIYYLNKDCKIEYQSDMEK